MIDNKIVRNCLTNIICDTRDVLASPNHIEHLLAHCEIEPTEKQHDARVFMMERSLKSKSFHVKARLYYTIVRKPQKKEPHEP
jgi:hypothetical protein